MQRRTFIGSLMAFGCRPGGPSAEPVESGAPAALETTKKPAPMIARPLPRTGELLPVIGLANWSGSVRADPTRSRTLLDGFIADGGRLLEVPAIGAESEQAAGDMLIAAGAVQTVFLATRVRVPGHREGQMQMERTLRGLGRRRIDLMQVHDLTDFATHLETLRRWRAVGHARYIGATIAEAAALPLLLPEIRGAGLDTVQLPYSIFSRAAESAVLLAGERGVAVLVSRPFGDPQAFASLRRRPLPELAGELECTSWGQLLLKWVLGHPAVRCVLPGADEVAAEPGLLRAGCGPLPDERQRHRLLTLVEAG